MQRPHFASRQEYGKRFTDVEYWQPYVEEICARHNFGPCNAIKAGFPGSNPVFIVHGPGGESFVVKLFTQLFGGAESHLKELELYGLFARFPQLPFPTLVEKGSLFPEGEGWHWPYIVTSAIAGTSIGEVYNQVAYEDKLAVAMYLGPILYKLHRLSLEGLRYFQRSWDFFLSGLERQRATCVDNQVRWKALPDHLIDQIDGYIPSIETLIDANSEPYLIHCDLNQDHVLGYIENGHWQTTGIIDFGDSRVGDKLYELLALHMGLFHGDKTLLRAFLESYGTGDMRQDGFVRKAMSFTLLFEFDALSQIIQDVPQLRKIGTLEELATFIWDIDEPGFLFK